MDKRRKMFEIYDELDLIAFRLDGVYQTIFAVDLETLSTFIDNQGRAAQDFLCHELFELTKRIQKCDEDLHELMNKPDLSLLEENN